MEVPRFRSHKLHWLARLHLSKTTRFILAVICALSVGAFAFAETPPVGSKAPDFTLSTPTGKAVGMSQVQRGHDLVLVILRGFPGYQCPYCVRQVHDFIDHASEFKVKNTRILLVYPGPPGNLDQHAKEFLAKQTELPSNVVLVTDPDYAVTNQYGLRWDAPHETAYPSTFILNKKGIIVFEKISHTHGDRLSAQNALEHLPAK
ncbi:MAG TPA: peroxiredoxin family protein [Acidobacteriaceae bacterium]|nr:peroxiredoxin family protein [Acidobacteriaceae bacterium]